MASVQAFVAATRFGLGARPGDLDAIESVGPRAWVLEQIDAPASAKALSDLPSTRAAVATTMSARRAEGDEKTAMRAELREGFASEQAAHLVTAASSPTPVQERFVAFWANHLTVSIDRREVLPIAGAFERDVIRASMTARFGDLLVRSTRHPAMLAYLDNLRSIGPRSMAGLRRDRGLNENLAREILELHSLGVDGGYTQADVESLAKLLTGWSLTSTNPGTAMAMANDAPGGFAFFPRRHEPGQKRLLDMTFPGNGEADGIAALKALGDHPATARHIATKLVRHFVADDPPAAAVATVARAFVHSHGHLPTVHRAVVNLDAAWRAPLTKLKTPRELVLSTARALSYEHQGHEMLAACRFLGQLPYQAPSPQGWPDRAEDWLGAEAVLTRLDWIEQVGKSARDVDALAVADAVIGPVLRPATRRAVAAASGPHRLALLLASPEFQRR